MSRRHLRRPQQLQLQQQEGPWAGHGAVCAQTCPPSLAGGRTREDDQQSCPTVTHQHPRQPLAQGRVQGQGQGCWESRAQVQCAAGAQSSGQACHSQDAGLSALEGVARLTQALQQQQYLLRYWWQKQRKGQRLASVSLRLLAQVRLLVWGFYWQRAACQCPTEP